MTPAEAYLGILHDLLALTTRLKEAVAERDWERLVRLLDERQALMDRADRAHPPDWRPEVREAQEAAALIAAIQALDQALSGEVHAVLTEARAQLQGMDAARATISAYQRASGVHPGFVESRFVDKQR
jgi:hypothetical protein